MAGFCDSSPYDDAAGVQHACMQADPLVFESCEAAGWVPARPTASCIAVVAALELPAALQLQLQGGETPTHSVHTDYYRLGSERAVYS